MGVLTAAVVGSGGWSGRGWGGGEGGSESCPVVIRRGGVIEMTAAVWMDKC
jgi:hypothetical protein